MKSFRQLIAVPVLAMCALLTFSACNNEPEEACLPNIAFGEAVSTRSGIVIAVDQNHAKQVYYAVLQRPTDATTPAIPTDADFKATEVTSLKGGKLLIPSSELKGNGTYDIYAYGHNGEIKSKQVYVSVVVDSEKYAPMLTFEVKNLSPYSLDVQVNITAECAKYVATVTRKEAYDAALFAEAAELSLNATEDQMSFGIQAYKPFYANALIPESQLLKSSRYDSQECVGAPLDRVDDRKQPIPYIVSVYGIDNFGNSVVYASEAFTLPEAVVVEGPKVEAVPVTTYSSVLGTFTASKECVKILYTALIANDKGLDFWKASNDAAIQEFLLSIPVGNAKPYAGTFTAKIGLNAQPGFDIVLVACGITADGSLSKFSYVTKPMRVPSFSGSAKATSVEAISSIDGCLKWKVNVTSNAKKIRMISTSQEFFNNTFVGTDEKKLLFEWTMVTDESTNGYGFWHEYDAAEFAANGNIYEIMVAPPVAGAEPVEYVIRVIASDEQGSWGEIVAGPNQSVLPEGATDNKLDLTNGTGKMTVTIESTTDNSDGCDITYKVAHGENTKNIYRTRSLDNKDYQSYADFTTDKLIATAKAIFTRENINEASLRTPGVTYEMTGMFYPSSWGTNFIIFVTEDNAGNFRTAAAIIPDVEAKIQYLY